MSPVPQKHIREINLKENFYKSPIPTRRNVDSLSNSPYLQRRSTGDPKWSSPVGSPLPLRHNFQEESQLPYNHENTSPIVLQRFFHQQKQQQQLKEAEEAAKSDSGI